MTTVKIAAVGDILMWGSQIRSANGINGGYDFNYMFQEISPLLKAADLTIGNLETTLSGREDRYQRVNPQTGWPSFNCPDELSDALKRAGFEVLTTANNHCMDRGITGLKRTIEVLDKAGIYHTGTFKTNEEAQNKLILTVKGIRIGILSFTYGTNHNPVPSEEPYAVNFINKNTLSQIYEMKKLVDLTIVCLHFGVEFMNQPLEVHRYTAQQCFEHGADIILGAHPHVIQPMKFKKVKDIDGIERNRFVIYSLGNFISDIMYNNIATVTGMVLNLYVTKLMEGKVSIEGAEYVPTWVLRNKVDNGMEFSVIPISKYLNNTENIIPPDTLSQMSKGWTNVTTLLGGIAK